MCSEGEAARLAQSSFFMHFLCELESKNNRIRVPDDKNRKMVLNQQFRRKLEQQETPEVANPIPTT